jgi:hypothetical protein
MRVEVRLSLGTVTRPPLAAWRRSYPRQFERLEWRFPFHRRTIAEKIRLGESLKGLGSGNALWTDLIIGIDRVLEIARYKPCEASLGCHLACHRFGKSQSAEP